MVAVDVAVRAGALLGECPLWSPEEAVLYREDIDGRLVHPYDPATGEDPTREPPGRPGSMVLTSRPGRLTLEPSGTGNRMNDGRTDPAGRFWVGSMYERALDPGVTGVPDAPFAGS